MSSKVTPPSADTGATGRRWTLVAAGLVVLAILACGVFVLANRGDASGATPIPTAPFTDPTASSPADQPTTSTPAPSGRCDLSAGDQTVPTTPIHGATWSLVNKFAVPESPKFGPQFRDGLRRCYAHSPTGAIYAAYNLIAALNVSDNDTYPAVARKVMIPGPDLEAHLQRFNQNPPGSSQTQTITLAGFKVVDATGNRVTVAIGASAGTAYVSSTWTVIWRGGDWKLRPPAPGDNPGEPIVQVPDLTGFVPWKGI